MSEDEKEKEEVFDQVVTTLGEDWNWEQVQKVWERISSLHDHFRRTDVELPWTARGSLFAAMQMFLIECGGDIRLAKAIMVDLLNACSSYVAGQVLGSMKVASTKEELQGQTLTPSEKETLDSNISTMEEAIESYQVAAPPPETLEAILSAQDKLASAMDEVHKEYGPEAAVKAIVVILAQSELFANQGDVMGAKVSVLDLLHQMWPLAIHNAQKLVQSASDQLKDGPAETRPN